ncbi:hypothetical protein HYH02_007688 [Chlamydomonas schloesseri]|uniref:Uncharacterized protein n=1 Tax=Chlamydomonas schloesseri TaxID=2026947 RepID=A0A835WI21_9CHLO|nr:hypothetical protein HYH02_007688 [Chlamydomonas schloesseri]|eukprot:KAG2447360.1 hypothetical protein HYH02_007688 [Chlamydomonas schloesseri]
MSEARDVLAAWDRNVGALLDRALSLNDNAAAAPMLLDAVGPPAYAKRMYKLVALDEEGVPTSIYDGTTRYYPGVTVFHDAQPEHCGGLYVYPSFEECLRAGASGFPRASRLAHAPRAIAVVLAWNHDGARLPVSYGAKKAYSYLQLVDLLPLPPTWVLTSGTANAEGAATPPDLGGPSPAPRRAVTLRPRSGTPESLAKSQAQTIRLELEVADMEQQLRLARSVLS